ncbi:LysR family transcriptional regulator [Nakamurella sp. YIM 132087]|uniref:LysR family transcriptional regulator n=1 Tax=Nakamurella alba TaxID=2665158 RepID=A0A7K1FIL4_9ACTN|nr:LysR family transcriptional regulator [Nakamurella alba]MTD13916.1 LysR family transcriptional regulator [Nakamurella alba]
MIDRRLQVLRMVDHTGTVTGAATALQYTPSAVSAQLRSLAEQLGVVLLVPDGRRLKLTAAGRSLVAHTDELFEHWERVQADVLAAADEPTGHLRMCGFSSAAAALLPPAAVAVAQALPAVRVSLVEAGPLECFDMLLTDEADIAVVVRTPGIPPTDHPRFEQHDLLDDVLDVMLPADHPLAGRRSVGFAELAGQRWIVDRPGTAYHSLFLAACVEAGFEPRVAHHAAEWNTGAAMIGAGLGCSLLPRLVPLPGGHPVVRVPLSGRPRPHRKIVTAVRRGSADAPVIAAARAAFARAAADLSA